MASKFEVRRFVDEFVRYANAILPYEPELGIFDFVVDFSIVRGRLCFAVRSCDFHYCSSQYANDVYALLESSITTMNRSCGYCNLGKNRTFVLSVDPEKGKLVYGVGSE